MIFILVVLLWLEGVMGWERIKGYLNFKKLKCYFLRFSVFKFVIGLMFRDLIIVNFVDNFFLEEGSCNIKYFFGLISFFFNICYIC